MERNVKRIWMEMFFVFLNELYLYVCRIYLLSTQSLFFVKKKKIKIQLLALTWWNVKLVLLWIYLFFNSYVEKILKLSLDNYFLIFIVGFII